MCRNLRDFSGNFLHYILHEFGVFGQVKTEVSYERGMPR